MKKEEEHKEGIEELEQVIAPQTDSTDPQDSDKKKPDTNKGKLLNTLLADDDDNNEATIRQWKEMMRTISIDGQWFRRQLWLLLLIVGGIIFYITNRYQAQQEIIEEEQLRNDLQDWKFRSLTRNSELTFRTRQSQIEKILSSFRDTTLLPSTQPPFKIEVTPEE